MRDSPLLLSAQNMAKAKTNEQTKYPPPPLINSPFVSSFCQKHFFFYPCTLLLVTLCLCGVVLVLFSSPRPSLLLPSSMCGTIGKFHFLDFHQQTHHQQSLEHHHWCYFAKSQFLPKTQKRASAQVANWYKCGKANIQKKLPIFLCCCQSPAWYRVLRIVRVARMIAQSPRMEETGKQERKRREEWSPMNLHVVSYGQMS